MATASAEPTSVSWLRVSRPAQVSRSLVRFNLDLHPEDFLVRLDDLVPDLGRELQLEARLLDGHHDRGDVLRLPGRDLLGLLRGVDLRGVELGDLVRERAPEAAAARRA